MNVGIFTQLSPPVIGLVALALRPLLTDIKNVLECRDTSSSAQTKDQVVNRGQLRYYTHTYVK